MWDIDVRWRSIKGPLFAGFQLLQGVVVSSSCIVGDWIDQNVDISQTAVIVAIASASLALIASLFNGTMLGVSLAGALIMSCMHASKTIKELNATNQRNIDLQTKMTNDEAALKLQKDNLERQAEQLEKLEKLNKELEAEKKAICTAMEQSHEHTVFALNELKRVIAGVEGIVEAGGPRVEELRAIVTEFNAQSSVIEAWKEQVRYLADHKEELGKAAAQIGMAIERLEKGQEVKFTSIFTEMTRLLTQISESERRLVEVNLQAERAEETLRRHRADIDASAAAIAGSARQMVADALTISAHVLTPAARRRGSAPGLGLAGV